MSRDACDKVSRYSSRAKPKKPARCQTSSRLYDSWVAKATNDKWFTNTDSPKCIVSFVVLRHRRVEPILDQLCCQSTPRGSSSSCTTLSDITGHHIPVILTTIACGRVNASAREDAPCEERRVLPFTDTVVDMSDPYKPVRLGTNGAQEGRKDSAGTAERASARMMMGPS